MNGGGAQPGSSSSSNASSKASTNSSSESAEKETGANHKKKKANVPPVSTVPLSAYKEMEARMNSYQRDMQREMAIMRANMEYVQNNASRPNLHGPLTIPEFSGVTKKQTAAAWLFSAESAISAASSARGHRITDEEMLSTLGIFLKDEALLWYRTVCNTLTTWAEFKRVFAEHFKVFNRQIEIRIELFSAKQRPEQSMKDFLNYKEKLLLERDDNTELDKVVQLLVQVTPAIRKKMLAKTQLSTWSEAKVKEEFLAMDLSWRQAHTEEKKEARTDIRKDNVSNKKRKREDYHKSRDTRDKKTLADVTCYNCNETGHYSKDCPNAKKKKDTNRHTSSSYSSS